MTTDDYHKDTGDDVPSLNSGTAKTLLEQSPLHAWIGHPRLNPNWKPDESARYDLGSAAHDLLLEGGTAKICVIDPEQYRSKPTKKNPEGTVPNGWTNTAIRAARDEARANRLVPILPWDNAKIRAMVETAQEYVENSELKGIFQRGRPEVKILWQEGETRCRGMLDWLTDDCSLILDFKTCANAHPEAFTRHLASMSYDVQAAFYVRGVNHLASQPHGGARFVFLAQEIEPPHACSLVELPDDWMTVANSKVSRAIALWQRCLSTNQWPGYASRVAKAETPAWLLNKALQDGDLDGLSYEKDE